VPEDKLTIREIQASDIPDIVQYWLGSDKLYLSGMGVEPARLPTAEQLTSNLQSQIETPVEKRSSFCIIWQLNGRSIGHSNTNPTNFGKDAFMHLHLWYPEVRSKGMGTKLLQLTVFRFFEVLKLKDLYCQPYSLNPAPHKALQKAGFELVKEYITVPGSLNFEQPVKLWHLSFDKVKELYKNGS